MPNRAKVLLLILLLTAEIEYLAVTNYPVRTELRALFGLPIYHVMLTFLTLAAMVRWAAPDRFSMPLGLRFSWIKLGLHIGCYALLLRFLEPLFNWSKHFSVVLSLLGWFLLGFVLLGSWLNSWLPLSRWWEFCRQHFYWLSTVCILSVVAPYLAEMASIYWFNFASLTFDLTEAALQVLYLDAVSDREQLALGTSRFLVQIGPGCSGYEGMGLITILLLAYFWIKRPLLRFPQAFVLLPVGLVLAYLGNIVRLILLVAIGTNISPEIAVRGFHSQAGWISFTILAVFLLVTVEKSGLFHKPTQPQGPLAEYLALPYLAPLMGLLLGTMVVAALSKEFQTFYFLKVVLASSILLVCLPRLGHEFVRPRSVSLAVGLLVYGVWVALVPVGTASNPLQVLAPPWGQIWILVRCLGAVLVVPLCEELAFRGYLIRRLQSPEFEKVDPARFAWKAALLSSALFALLHTDWLAAFLAGMAYSWVASRPGHLSNAVAAHALTNACLALEVLYAGHWGLW